MDRLTNWLESIGHDRVLLRTNEDEPYVTGRLVSFEDICGTDVPLVHTDDGRDLVCMGIVVPYSPALAEALDRMPPAHQWAVLRDISLAIKIRNR